MLFKSDGSLRLQDVLIVGCIFALCLGLSIPEMSHANSKIARGEIPSKDMECVLTSVDTYMCTVANDSCRYYYKNSYYFPYDTELLLKECD